MLLCVNSDKKNVSFVVFSVIGLHLIKYQALSDFNSQL